MIAFLSANYSSGKMVRRSTLTPPSTIVRARKLSGELVRPRIDVDDLPIGQPQQEEGEEEELDEGEVDQDIQIPTPHLPDDEENEDENDYDNGSSSHRPLSSYSITRLNKQREGNGGDTKTNIMAKFLDSLEDGSDIPLSVELESRNNASDFSSDNNTLKNDSKKAIPSAEKPPISRSNTSPSLSPSPSLSSFPKPKSITKRKKSSPNQTGVISSPPPVSSTSPTQKNSKSISTNSINTNSINANNKNNSNIHNAKKVKFSASKD